MTYPEAPHNDTNPVEDALIFSLNDTKAARHNKRMLELSHHTTGHESAYAVYENNGKFETSRLILPERDDREHKPFSVQMGELVVDNAMGTRVQVEFTENELRAMHNIRLAEELSDEEKDTLIRKIEEKAKFRAQGVHSSGFRKDVAINVHNHPLESEHEDIENALVPSGEDVRNHGGLESAHPGHVSGILSSAKGEDVMLLYGAEVNRDQDPLNYDVESDERRLTLKELGRRGYVSTVVKLGKHGKMKASEKPVLKDFSRQIKTKK